MSDSTRVPFTGNASTPALYFQWLKQLSENQTIQQRDEHAPFLSVLMRTQGKRGEMLKEALLSLEAQSDQDFEIILIIHRAKEEDKEATLSLLEALSPALTGKLTHRFLDTGTRAAPLNLALSLAKGDYIAMLDDDDVVFEDWVENFHTGAKETDGKVIRCYGMMQFWSLESSPSGKKILQSIDAPRPTYCAPFDLKAHFEDNHTPISCIAIPRACHSIFGVSFDEYLTTAEDWDFLMRCILLCGVHDTKKITFLYRMWQTGDTSHKLHSESEWLSNRAYIMEKLKTLPYVTCAAGQWPLRSEESAEENICLKPSFWRHLRDLIRTHGLLKLPFLVIRKIFYRLFG